MIRRNTWFLFFLFIVAIGAYIYVNNRKAQQAASATPTTEAGVPSGSTLVFPASVGAPTDIVIKDTTGKTVEVARNGSGSWVLKAPTEAPADQASAEAAATQVSALRVLSSVQLDLNIVGLDKPAYSMSFTFQDNSKHTLSIGSVTPIQDGYYTSLDGGPVKIVDKPGLDALILLLTKPPYIATPTPPITDTPTAETPTAEPTSTALPNATGTPAATGSPTPTVTP